MSVLPDDQIAKPAFEPSSKMFVGGRWLDSRDGETLAVFNPSTGRQIATIPNAGYADVDLAVKSAQQALDSGPWGRMPARERGLLIRKLSDLIEKNRIEFAQLEALDNGKPFAAANAYDVAKTIEWFEYFSGWPTKMNGQVIPADSPSKMIYTTRQPVGVVGQIIPWNFPLMMAAWKLAPALAAGCTVVLKPAEETPLSALLLGRLVQEAGFPDGVVNILTGAGEKTGVAMVSHPGIAKIAFTGSTSIGKSIMAGSAPFLRRLTLELGGNSPNILLDDIDVESVVAQLADAAFANHGQNCCAGTRLFVPRALEREVSERLGDIARRIKVGPGMDPASDMGPLISNLQKQRVQVLVADSADRGAKIVFGGGTPADQAEGYFFEPTVISNVDDDMPIVREEIFGPVITVLPYDTLDEVVTRANATEYGLAAGIWTRDLNLAHETAAKIRAGTVWINTYNETSPAVPFGGFGHSGYGREHGEAVLDHYTEIKSVWVNMDPSVKTKGNQA